MRMFLLNRGYSLKYNDKLAIHGMIVNISGLMMPAIERRDIPETDILLFDPQLYFPLNYSEKCQNTFCKLSTYPWFNATPPEFDSTIINITNFRKELKAQNSNCNVSIPETIDEIRKRIMSCIEFQVSEEINATHIILPVPLVEDPEDEFSTQLVWINEGLDIASKFHNKKVLITVALSEDVIIHKAFEKNALMQTIIDNLTAIEEVEGFYIVISRSSNNSNITEKNIVQTVLELSYLLGKKINKKVILNFVDNLGFLGIAAGAYAFGSGYTNKERRLNFSDFIDKESGGAPLPHFYSYSLIGDFYPERDLSKIRDARLLRYIKGDITSFSKSLYNALMQKKDISQLVDWKETLNNVATAKNHRTELMIDKVNFLNTLNFSEKIEYTLEWLQNAESSKLYFDNLFEDDPLDEDGKHIIVWRKCFEQFLNKYKLI